MTIDDYPALCHFFSCYFHQDWPEEFDEPDMAVDAFVESEPKESVLSVVKELEGVITSGYKNEDLLHLLIEFGCYYYPEEDCEDALSWIKKIRARLVSQA